jgi:hypothetical protein
MKRISAFEITMLFGLLSANVSAVQKDAAGCKDNPLMSMSRA